MLQVNYNFFPQPSSSDLLDTLIAIHFTAHRQAVYVLLPGTSLLCLSVFNLLRQDWTRRTTTNFNFSSVDRSDLPPTINSSIGPTLQLDEWRPRSKSNRRRRRATTTGPLINQLTLFSFCPPAHQEENFNPLVGRQFNWSQADNKRSANESLARSPFLSQSIAHSSHSFTSNQFNGGKVKDFGWTAAICLLVRGGASSISAVGDLLSLWLLLWLLYVHGNRHPLWTINYPSIRSQPVFSATNPPRANFARCTLSTALNFIRCRK